MSRLRPSGAGGHARHARGARAASKRATRGIITTACGAVTPPHLKISSRRTSDCPWAPEGVHPHRIPSWGWTLHFAEGLALAGPSIRTRGRSSRKGRRRQPLTSETPWKRGINAGCGRHPSVLGRGLRRPEAAGMHTHCVTLSMDAGRLRSTRQFTSPSSSSWQR